MKHLLIYAILLSCLASCGQVASDGQWTPQQAKEWYSGQEWPVGCNYVPSYAINQYEFWQADSFSPEVIDRELALAESIGFNTVRIYLHEGLWYDDAEGFKSRIDRFLDIADSHGIRVVVTFFTNGGNHDISFSIGPQPQPAPGQHNSSWIPSPAPA